MIDLRSDTCSRPTPEMRAAMANAEVGDDLYGDDPTVKALERATAELLGKEDTVYMGSPHDLLKTARQGPCTNSLPFGRVLKEGFATEIARFGVEATTHPHTFVCERS